MVEGKLKEVVRQNETVKIEGELTKRAKVRLKVEG